MHKIEHSHYYIVDEATKQPTEKCVIKALQLMYEHSLHDKNSAPRELKDR